MEESILQQNVPGKWSSHSDNSSRQGDRPNSNSVNNNNVDDADDEDNNHKCHDESIRKPIQEGKEVTYSHIPDSISQQILSKRSLKPNTGVKGVIADRKAHQELQSAEALFKSAYRQQVLKRMVEGHKVIQSSAEDEVCNDINVDDDDDDSDDDFLTEYRQKRLLELKTSKPLKLFGQCYDVNNDQFLQEIETIDVIVIVHLFDPSIQSCVKMNNLLEIIAAEMNHLKFLRFNARVNDVEVDRLTLPILSFYRNGESINVCAGIEEELGGNFTKDDVEWLIQTTLQSTHL